VTTSLPTSTTEATTTLPPEPVEVFTVRLDGGCMMMGPNCPEYRFLSDGSVAVFRAGEVEPTDTAAINLALVTSVVDLVASTDLEALSASLPPGECRGCYDGIDVTYIYGPDGVFASIDIELVSTEPLFAATEAALAAAQGALGELPIVSR
jgi:hypothetical protein